MFALTPKQQESFASDGFVIVENLIDQETVRSLRESFDDLFRGEFETGVRPDEVNWQEGTGDPSLTRQICNGWKANRAIARVISRSDLGEALARLAGWRGTRIMIDNVIWKPPSTRSLNYHQDNAYLAWYTPSELLTCWIALDDTTAEGGTLELVRGSHRWQASRPEGEFHGPKDYTLQMNQAAQREGTEPEIVHVEVPAGGGSFHHGWTWHGSGPNLSSKPRRSLVLHGMPCDVRYDPANLDVGIGPIYGRYKHLDNNEMDEHYFPVIWRDDGYRTSAIDHFTSSR